MESGSPNGPVVLSYENSGGLIAAHVSLPVSKSESNRILMIAAYGGSACNVQNLSDAHDTVLLHRLLRQIAEGFYEIDCQDAGTVARFLLTYLACREGSWVLTGNERLRQRPMGDLVDALKQMGASLCCLSHEGFLPIKVDGRRLQGGDVTLNMGKSSQFASSLLLAAPLFPRGLNLHLDGRLSSLPYIDLTLSLMNRCGAKAKRNGRDVVVAPKPYSDCLPCASHDWSAASYWFEMAALAQDCDIVLDSLSLNSEQGDMVIVEMMRTLGVVARQCEQGVRLRKNDMTQDGLVFDFSNNPDLFPAVAGTCAGLQKEAKFVGIKNLALKESDRVEALSCELGKIGVVLQKISDDVASMTFKSPLPFSTINSPVVFNAHDDHRIAMALAPLTLKLGSVRIDNPQCVAKSYPSFWMEIGKIFKNS